MKAADSERLHGETQKQTMMDYFELGARTGAMRDIGNIVAHEGMTAERKVAEVKRMLERSKTFIEDERKKRGLEEAS